MKCKIQDLTPTMKCKIQDLTPTRKDLIPVDTRTSITDSLTKGLAKALPGVKFSIFWNRSDSEIEATQGAKFALRFTNEAQLPEAPTAAGKADEINLRTQSGASILYIGNTARISTVRAMEAIAKGNVANGYAWLAGHEFLHYYTQMAHPTPPEYIGGLFSESPPVHFTELPGTMDGNKVWGFS